MPYNPETRKGIICPPKCGTITVMDVMRQMGPVKAVDHKTLQEAQEEALLDGLKPADMEWAMNVRHPLERLVSAINAYAGWNGETGLDVSMEHARDQVSIVFRPQAHFLQGAHADRVRLFPFDTMEALEWLGWTRAVPFHNRSQTNYPLSMIKRHRLYPELIALYDADYELWRKLK